MQKLICVLKQNYSELKDITQKIKILLIVVLHLSLRILAFVCKSKQISKLFTSIPFIK